MLPKSVRCLVAAALPVMTLLCPASAQDSDSLSVEQLQEAVVSAVRASADAPYSVSNIDSKSLHRFSVTGRELPMLFARTPGVLAWSENGVGTGTSYMRIRGAAGSRINVTIDGVPLNSPEDQCVFWANMNSYASFLGSVQIQRGVGSSTNGDGAFGGSVSLGTRAPSLLPSAEYTASYGSYNTFNTGVSFSSGLLWGHMVLDGAWHETSTDGYLHGTDGHSGSYMGAVSWLGSDFTLRYRYIGNFEQTGQAWNGVTAGTSDLSIMDGTYGASTGIRSYKDMWKAGLGRYNSLYEMMDPSDYSTHRYALKDGSLWPRTTDNFWQDHHILSFAWRISPQWSLSTAAHFTHGYGYYEEFRPDNKLVKYGISTFTDPFTGSTVKGSDFVRKKGLRQNTDGALANLRYNGGAWDAIAGVSVQGFSGNHFGRLSYIGNDTLERMLLGSGQSSYSYYESDATKVDASAFVKASYKISEAWAAFADLQYRHVDYKTGGYNDKYIDNGDGTASKHYLDVDEHYNFFNPKAGVSCSAGAHRAYASLSVSHREPERNNFTDNGKYPAPSAERLFDYELGYHYAAAALRLGAALYYMRYKDQLVQTGQISDIGEYLTTNIPGSYRAGVELTAAWDLSSFLTLEGNAALSRNRLLDFDEYVEDWDDWEGNPDAAKWHCDGNGDGMRVLHYDDSPLAFSPSAILNGFVNVHFGSFRAVWHSSFVSRQYLDNSGSKERSLSAFSLSSLSLGYTLRVGRSLREVDFGLDLGNLFSARVAQSGWVYSAIAESYGHTPDNRYYQIGFVPTAGFTATGSITLRF